MKKTFNLNCTMEERWIPYFMSFLSQMEFMGKLGYSAPIAFHTDGSNDFKPEFKADIIVDRVEPVARYKLILADVLYDAR